MLPEVYPLIVELREWLEEEVGTSAGVELRDFGTKNSAPDAAPDRIWGTPRCWLQLGLKYCVTCEAYALSGGLIQ